MAATELTELEKFELRIAAIERFGDLEKYEALANLDARLTRIESLSSISVLLTRGG